MHRLLSATQHTSTQHCPATSQLGTEGRAVQIQNRPHEHHRIWELPLSLQPLFSWSPNTETWQIIRLHSRAAMKADVQQEPSTPGSGGVHPRFQQPAPAHTSPNTELPHQPAAAVCPFLFVCLLLVCFQRDGGHKTGPATRGLAPGEDNEHTGGNQSAKETLHRAHDERAAPPAELCLPACERGRRS